MMRQISRKIRLLIREIIDLMLMPIIYLPGFLGNKIRYIYWKSRLNSLGKNSVIDVGVQILNPNWISIGENTHIDKFSILVAGPLREGKRVICNKTNDNYKGEKGQLIIGNNSHIAPYVLINAQGGVLLENNANFATGSKIFSISNHYRNLNDKNDNTLFKFSNRVSSDQQCIIVGPVVMKKNSGLGINSVILPGATIGENSWVGSMSCVINNIPPNVIASGNPAKTIKKRI
ncbi:MAG: acyltransferase [Candidatus Helarchaeota archaeon]